MHALRTSGTYNRPFLGLFFCSSSDLVQPCSPHMRSHAQDVSTSGYVFVVSFVGFGSPRHPGRGSPPRTSSPHHHATPDGWIIERTHYDLTPIRRERPPTHVPVGAVLFARRDLWFERGSARFQAHGPNGRSCVLIVL